MNTVQILKRIRRELRSAVREHRKLIKSCEAEAYYEEAEEHTSFIEGVEYAISIINEKLQ